MFRIRLANQLRRVLPIAVLAAFGGCSDVQPTAPAAPTTPNALLGLPSPGATLVECPTDDALTAAANVEPLTEALLSVGGSSVLFPAGAVLDPINARLTVPASRYMEIRLRVNGEEHFDFELPLTVTIDYSRCKRTDVLLKPLSVWYIDSETKELLYPMGGVDNKLTRTVTFLTDHFSGYAIAF